MRNFSRQLVPRMGRRSTLSGNWALDKLGLGARRGEASLVNSAVWGSWLEKPSRACGPGQSRGPLPAALTPGGVRLTTSSQGHRGPRFRGAGAP